MNIIDDKNFFDNQGYTEVFNNNIDKKNINKDENKNVDENDENIFLIKNNKKLFTKKEVNKKLRFNNISKRENLFIIKEIINHNVSNIYNNKNSVKFDSFDDYNNCELLYNKSYNQKKYKQINKKRCNKKTNVILQNYGILP
jgi:hypothetical protein